MYACRDVRKHAVQGHALMFGLFGSMCVCMHARNDVYVYKHVYVSDIALKAIVYIHTYI